MTVEEISEMINKSGFNFGVTKNAAFLGLQVISKYLKDVPIQPAHDVLYSASVEDLANSGITKEDVERLADLNWHIDEEFECLAKFI